MLGRQRPGEVIIVGVCAAGKSTLARALQGSGIAARTVAQEHSCIPELWQWSGAETVVYLHATYSAVKRRRHSFMTERIYQEQLHRLRNARRAATISIDTSDLEADVVRQLVQSRLHEASEHEDRVAAQR